MLIHFKHVEDNREGESAPDKGPLALGEGAEEATALCSMYTLTLYEQTFHSDIASKHKSIVDDLTDYGKADDGDPLGYLVATNWEAATRALWAMLKTGDEAGLNQRPTPGYREWVKAHAGDDVDIYKMNALVSAELTACFPSLSALLDGASKGRKKRK